jgi:hypothetical protein
MRPSVTPLALALLLLAGLDPASVTGADGSEPLSSHPSPRRALRPFGAVAGDTVFFGGTVWDAVDARWEAIQDSVWTFDSGVGSNYDHANPDVDPTKDPSLHALMEGWVGKDLTDLPYFRRLAAADFGAAPACVGSAVGLGGTASLHVGTLPGEGYDLLACNTGYGNNWSVCTEQTFTYGGTGNVHFTYDYVADSEPGKDRTRVEVDPGGGPIVLATYEGAVSGSENFLLKSGTELPSGGGPYTLRFCFTSDFRNSDQDGGYVSSCGAFTVDDIGVSGGGLN